MLPSTTGTGVAPPPATLRQPCGWSCLAARSAQGGAGALTSRTLLAGRGGVAPRSQRASLSKYSRGLRVRRSQSLAVCANARRRTAVRDFSRKASTPGWGRGGGAVSSSGPGALGPGARYGSVWCELAPRRGRPGRPAHAGRLCREPTRSCDGRAHQRGHHGGDATTVGCGLRNRQGHLGWAVM